MNRITSAFAGKKAFISFITGGDPDLATTEQLLYTLDEAGSDIIEIGIPFSDPIAEGPVIEMADMRALAAGCTTDKLFELAAKVRHNVKAPIVFLTYYNPVFSYGIDRFVLNCAAAGLDGMIVPDLPFEERDELYLPCKEKGLELISLIAPTSKRRIERIAKNSGGFLYCVSSLGVTGVRSSLNEDAREMIRQAKAVSDIPCAVGFGISAPEQARSIASFADGVIVGSAIVKLVAQHGKASAGPVSRFAKELRRAINNN